MVTVEHAVVSEPDFANGARGDLDCDAVRRLVASVLDEHGEHGSVTVVLTDDRALRDLNKEYRNIDAPTDVLSFNLDDEWVAEGQDDVPLGDIYISLERAGIQAADAGRSLQEEVQHLAVHGSLHLLGFEHDTDAGFRAMCEEEDRFLTRRPVPDVEAYPEDSGLN